MRILRPRGYRLGHGERSVQRLRHLWRVLATGFSFAVLSIGGFVLAVTAIPFAGLLAPDAATRRRRAQRIIRASFRLYIWMLRRLGLITFQVIGEQDIAEIRGKIVIANHPTLLDTVLVMSLLPNAQCVVKHQLWKHPLLGALVRAAGYVRNDLPAEELLAACRDALRAGGNLVIFPEGTRSIPGRPCRLHRGFAHIATLAEADLSLIRISCSPITLIKNEAWYRVPDRTPHFCVEMVETLEIEPFMQGSPRPLAARRLVSHVERRFAEA